MAFFSLLSSLSSHNPLLLILTPCSLQGCLWGTHDSLFMFQTWKYYADGLCSLQISNLAIIKPHEYEDAGSSPRMLHVRGRIGNKILLHSPGPIRVSVCLSGNMRFMPRSAYSIIASLEAWAEGSWEANLSRGLDGKIYIYLYEKVSVFEAGEIQKLNARTVGLGGSDIFRIAFIMFSSKGLAWSWPKN